MRRALIGHTGFVGGTLLAGGGFSHGFNSRDFNDMRGESFDEVVCAGIPAVKWLANREPDQDRQAIGALLAVLETVRADRFVLISTVDVYPDPARPLDETAVLAGLPNHPYGQHRLEVEEFVAARFANHAIVRLPALFGDGLKKNALYDLIHDNDVDRLNPEAVFQWYPTRRLAGDLVRVARAGLRLVNLVTEPVPLSQVIERFFPAAPVGPATAPAPRYDLRTRHAELFGGTAPYITGRAQVLLAMGDFIKSTRRR
jgi:nucleoside-diphosphate-sugar epimerase